MRRSEEVKAWRYLNIFLFVFAMACFFIEIPRTRSLIIELQEERKMTLYSQAELKQYVREQVAESIENNNKTLMKSAFKEKKDALSSKR